MNNAYRKLMEQQSLSEEAKQEFYRSISQKKAKRVKPILLKTAIAAACIAALLPVTVFAVENIFGISIVKSVTGKTFSGRKGIGYEVSYAGTYPRPLSDFSEQLQKLDGYETKVYDTWQDAEEELGFSLIDNDVLFSENTQKEPSYNLQEIGLGRRVHCFASFEGLEGQMYRATLTAGYRYDNMSITVRSTVGCEHPAISSEEAKEQLDWIEVLYEEKDIAEIRQEQYTAKNGITATIISIVRKNGKSADYEAAFVLNGASYRITIDPNARDGSRDEAAKAHLIKILEGFES